MADRELGIKITAKDLASAPIKKLINPVNAIGAALQKSIGTKQQQDALKVAAALGGFIKQTNASAVASQKLGLEAAKAFGNFAKQASVATAAMQKMEAESRTLNGRINGAFASMGAAAVGFKAKMAGVLQSLKTNWLIYSAAIYATIRAVTAAINSFADLEKQMKYVNTIARKSDEELKAMTDGVSALSKQYGISAVDIAKSLYDIYSNLGETGNNMAILEAATIASVAGFADMAITGAALTGVISAMGAEAGDVNDILDVQFKTIERGKINYDQLATSSGMFLKQAQFVGQEYADVMAGFATVTKDIQNVERSATGLRAFFARFGEQEFADNLKALNITVRDSNGAFRDYGDVINDIAKYVDGLNEGDKIQVLSKLVPSQEARAAFFSLVGSVKTFNEDLVAMKDRTDAAKNAFSEMADTSAMKMAKITQRWEELKRKMGEKVALGLDEQTLKILETAINGTAEALIRFSSAFMAVASNLAYAVSAILAPIIIGLKTAQAMQSGMGFMEAAGWATRDYGRAMGETAALAKEYRSRTLHGMPTPEGESPEETAAKKERVDVTTKNLKTELEAVEKQIKEHQERLTKYKSKYVEGEIKRLKEQRTRIQSALESLGTTGVGQPASGEPSLLDGDGTTAAVDKAVKAYENLGEQFKIIDLESQHLQKSLSPLEAHYERAQQKVSALESAIKAYIADGLDPESAKLKELGVQLEKMRGYRDEAKVSIDAQAQAEKDKADADAERLKKEEERVAKLNDALETSVNIYQDYYDEIKSINEKAPIFGWTKEEVESKLKSNLEGTLDRAIDFALTPEGAQVGMQNWIDELAAALKNVNADELKRELAKKTQEALTESINKAQEKAKELAAKAIGAAQEAAQKQKEEAADLAVAKFEGEIADLERSLIEAPKTAEEVMLNLATQRLIIEKQIADLKAQEAGATPGEIQRLENQIKELEFKEVGLGPAAEAQKQQIKDAGKVTYLNLRDSVSNAISDGISGGGWKNALAGFADTVKQALTRKVSDALTDALLGGAGGGGIFGGGGGKEGKGGGLGGLLGGGLGGILGAGALIFGLSSLFGGGEKAGIAKPEPLGPKYEGGAFGGERPLYGSARMQLAQFSGRNVGGALHRMASEGPQVNVNVEIVDKTSTGTAVRNIVVKQSARERRRGPRRLEY